MIETITVKTSERSQLIDVTDRVADQVRHSGVREGYVICYVPHTTAGITIQENADPSVVADLVYKLGALVECNDPHYRHREGNSDAHIKASLVGSSVTVLIRRGTLVLGTWQGIYFCEFDGPRSRSLHIRVVAG